MPGGEAFFDSNVPLYLISGHAQKRDRAKALMAKRGVVSTQVLNEFAAVASRKFRVAWPAIREVLDVVKAICRVDPLSLAIHEHGIAVAERYHFNVHDSLIIAAALHGGCSILYSEDMRHGQAIDGLTVTNPFLDL